ncbi:septum site-determining protein MinC [Thermosinus carboxydivorans Nor1]|uniref:Probable septum site-determining protein MinC n=1 Tax=Thermosinus carboxydivorans Nor1 TaxID=401526 RepID=A1HP00_9FIRM|nr:septum site-determining protein MinC [Thermosinus carboxydivorans]EAX48108.1 septum site-determining protein MinC [Thermosinus carboxydivorans Nor1]
MAETVVFKGTKGGLRLLFDETEDFAVVLQQLAAKLEQASAFFTAGASIAVPAAATFMPEQRQQLRDLLARYGLIMAEPEAPMPAKREEGPLAAGKDKPSVLVIGKTLRGGQKVEYDGAIIVVGDVNPGAVVIAGGDITILGACRGVAHAGAYGNREATITADRLMATQLRIADLIARAPDHLEEPQCPERARIVGEAVIIEPA